MQRDFKREGVDIRVTLDYSSRHTVVLTGDEFRDRGYRDQALAAIRSKLRSFHACSIGLWDIRGEFDKGFLHENVGRTISLGCPEERAARDAQVANQRQDYVDSFNKELVEQKLPIKLAAHGSTLVLSSPDFLPDGGPLLAQILTPTDVAHLCNVGFSAYAIEGPGFKARQHQLKCMSAK